MICPRCQSQYVNVQVINEVDIKNKHHGVFCWLLIGWWWIIIKWVLFTFPALILKLFGHKKVKVVNKQKTLCVCQQCGYTWQI